MAPSRGPAGEGGAEARAPEPRGGVTQVADTGGGGEGGAVADVGGGGALGGGGSAPEAAPEPFAPVESSWCDAGWLAVSDGLCFYVPESVSAEAEVLIVLHGMSPPDAVHRSVQQMAAALADETGAIVLFPRGRQGLCGWDASVTSYWCWPTARTTVDQFAPALVAEWLEAEALIARHLGATVVRRHVLGFSNGGYFAAYLGLERWLDVDPVGASGFGVVGAGRWVSADGAEPGLPPFYISVGALELSSTRDSAENLAYVLSLHDVEHQLFVDPARGHSLTAGDFTRAWALWH